MGRNRKTGTDTDAVGTAALNNLTDCIAKELVAVDQLFHEELASELACVNTLVKHVSRFR